MILAVRLFYLDVSFGIRWASVRGAGELTVFYRLSAAGNGNAECLSVTSNGDDCRLPTNDGLDVDQMKASSYS